MDHDERKSRTILWLADYIGDNFFMTHEFVRWRTPDDFPSSLSRLPHLTPVFHSRLSISNAEICSLTPIHSPKITRGGVDRLVLGCKEVAASVPDIGEFAAALEIVYPA